MDSHSPVYTCVHCARSFPSRMALNGHQRAHSSLSGRPRQRPRVAQESASRAVVMGAQESAPRVVVLVVQESALALL